MMTFQAGAELASMGRDARAFAERRQLVLDGPLVLLPPQVVGILSLALHELATNAAKYGALSSMKELRHAAPSCHP